jgi:hypothetical protein
MYHHQRGDEYIGAISMTGLKGRIEGNFKDAFFIV